MRSGRGWGRAAAAAGVCTAGTDWAAGGTDGSTVEAGSTLGGAAEVESTDADPRHAPSLRLSLAPEAGAAAV